MKKIYILQALSLTSIVCVTTLQAAEQAQPKVSQVSRPTMLSKQDPALQRSLAIINAIESDEKEETILQKLQQLIATGPSPMDLNFVTQSKPKNPLCCACKNGLQNVIDLLCAHGANPNTCIAGGNQKYTSPLLIAVQKHPTKQTIIDRLF